MPLFFLFLFLLIYQNYAYHENGEGEEPSPLFDEDKHIFVVQLGHSIEEDNNLYQLLRSTFAQDQHVVIKLIDSSSSSSSSNNNKSNNKNKITHYAAVVKDRTCLLSPPFIKKRAVNIYPDDHVQPSNVVSWANSVLGTFRTPEGSLSPVGELIFESLQIQNSDPPHLPSDLY